ncbi:MAG: RluA family pseudouridine synthase [FCB group bacterium]
MKNKENLAFVEFANNAEQNNYPDYIETKFEFLVPKGQNTERLDVYLANNIKNATRTKVQKAIDEGLVYVNGKNAKSSYKIQPNDEITCTILKPPPIQLIPENIPLQIVYEDAYLLVVNKPAGMCSHPGFGNRHGTLVNAVLYYLGVRDSIRIEIEEDEEADDDERQSIDEGIIFASDAIRPGLVHRLDKDTSGLIVISKNPVIHAKLAKQFFERTVEKYYYALVWGEVKNNSGIITGDIGRSNRDRKLFAVVNKGGKPATTEYNVLERYDYLTLLKIKLLTGRTHQIRVHLSYIKHPVFGDKFYKGDSVVYGGNNLDFKKIAENYLKITNHQLLHAKSLAFTHPETGEKLFFESELPDDFIKIISTLKK